MASFDYNVEHREKDVFRCLEIERCIIDEADPESSFAYLIDECMENIQLKREQRGRPRLKPEKPFASVKGVVRQRLLKTSKTLVNNIESKEEKKVRLINK